MECVQSIELLSEYYAGALNETLHREVRFHLVECPPCKGLMGDIEIIVQTAHFLRDAEIDIAYPDESVVWTRMNLVR